MQRAEHVSRRLKLRHLNVLMAVARCGSMAKAAEHLAVSQPVVSKAIAELEQILGVRLLDRGPHGVEPTAHGRALLNRSAAIFDDLRTSVSELEFLSDPTAGELRIGCEENLATGLLPALIDRLAGRYPRIEFAMVIADPKALMERDLKGRTVEIAIMRTAAPRVEEGFGRPSSMTTASGSSPVRGTPYSAARRFGSLTSSRSGGACLHPITRSGHW
jgi:DNA-binding transcriptional LysR family regulator